MKIEIVNHEKLRTQRAALLAEAEKWLSKIVKLNTRYSCKIRNIRDKIEKLDAKLGD